MLLLQPLNHTCYCNSRSRAPPNLVAVEVGVAIGSHSEDADQNGLISMSKQSYSVEVQEVVSFHVVKHK